MNQTDANPRRIAMFTYAADVPGYGTQLDMAEKYLARIGYRDGETAAIRRYFGNRDLALTAQHAKSIVEWGAEVVLSFMTNADLAMIEATRENPIPIVCWSMDPVGAGLVKSIQRPGGNLTAVTWSPGYESTLLRVLRALNPAIDRVGYLHNPTYAPAPAAFQNIQRAGNLFRIDIIDRICLDPATIEAEIAAMADEGAQAILVGPHELLSHNGARVAAAAMTHGIPSIGGDMFGTFGYPASFVPDFEHVWQAAADVADRLLNGADPATTPVARFIKPLFMLNPGVIARLGLDLPEWLLSEADGLFGVQTP